MNPTDVCQHGRFQFGGFISADASVSEDIEHQQSNPIFEIMSDTYGKHPERPRVDHQTFELLIGDRITAPSGVSPVFTSYNSPFFQGRRTAPSSTPDQNQCVDALRLLRKKTSRSKIPLKIPGTRYGWLFVSRQADFESAKTRCHQNGNGQPRQGLCAYSFHRFLFFIAHSSNAYSTNSINAFIARKDRPESSEHWPYFLNLAERPP